jgi:hypothetical protein
MSEVLSPPAADGRDKPGNVNNQSPDNHDLPHPEAFGARFGAPPDEGAVQGEVQGADAGAGRPAAMIDLARLTARDRSAIQTTVLLRLLTYDQLHHLTFPTVEDKPTVRRRIRHIERAGWIKTWEAPARHGGHTRYVHPTKEALRLVLPACAARTATEPWAPLVNRMVPRSTRRELDLGHAAPKWLAHQREVNHLITAIATVPERRVVWASSWDCPFPSRFGMFPLPQPDYVLVEEVGGVPLLIFGEHDRASEPVDRFVRRKIALYSALAAFPEVSEELFGVRSFRVYVTSIDPITQHPIARLRALMEATRAHGGPDIFRFSLGGWLYASPSAPVWFTAVNAPATESPGWAEHASALIAA